MPASTFQANLKNRKADRNLKNSAPSTVTQLISSPPVHSVGGSTGILPIRPAKPNHSNPRKTQHLWSSLSTT